MKILIIPAYEPDHQLLTLLSILRVQYDFTIIIVNDGSSDACNEIFFTASKYGIVLKHHSNQGKGEAIKTALTFIRRQNYKGVIVTADADGQHKPQDINRVAAASIQFSNSLIIGSRRFTGSVPFKSRFGNTITRYIFSFASGVPVYDTQSGLRGFSSSMIPFLLSVEGARYEYEMNVLLKSADIYEIREIPIDTIYLDNNRSSHFRPFKDALLIYKDLFKFGMASFAGFLTEYAIYSILITCLGFCSLGTRLLIANITARIISASVNFSLNKKYVFHNQDRVLKTGMQYFTLSAIMLTMDTLGIGVLNSVGFDNLYTSKIIVEFLLFFVSWGIQRKVIFKHKSITAATAGK